MEKDTSENRLTPDTEQDKSRRIVHNTLFLYGQMFVQMMVALLTARMLFNALGVIDYGIYNVIGGVVTVFSVLNNVEGATIRFLTYDIGKGKKQEDVHLMFSTARIVHLVIALAILLLAESVGLYYVFHHLVIPPERLQATLTVYHFSVISILFSVACIPYEALLIAHEKMKAFASLGIMQTLLGVAIVFAVKYSPIDKLILYGALILLVQVAVRIVYGLYCQRHFPETTGRWLFDKSLFIRMLKFAGWSFNGTMAWIAFTEGVNLLLNAFFGPVMNAARGIAFTVQQKVGDFARKFLAAVNPQIVKSVAQNDLPYLHKLLIVSSRFSLLLLFILSFPILLETKTILHLWLGHVPDYTVAFTRLALLSIMVDTLGRILIMTIHATGKIAKFQLVEANILLLIVPISYLCLKMGYSPIAVYVTQLIIFIVAQTARVMIVCPAVNMQCSIYFRDIVLRSFLCMGAASILPILTWHLIQPMQSGILHLTIITTVSLISSCFATFYIGCDQEMRNFIKRKLIHKLTFSK